ncbi:MAG: tRNA lysidine(34) synthetase TilS [Ruminococcaceae bacterium]|nr:tRNA lysidine(34) synthetase TilS [Oscillospiraceae bacterium]
MYNKLVAFVRQYDMVQPGDHIICAVSGGADSVALLFGLYLAREKLGIRLSAAHYNHHLRGEESDSDARFVRELCDRFDIPLYEGQGQVVAGEKGLEAAAREARYAFFRTLPGKIATAHTADDNAETVLLHLVRGTGLKGLGGITPVGENLIRPMLLVTRQEVEAFLEEYCLKHIQDSSNASDAFLRNRLRHHVMPLLKAENPRLAVALSESALRLRQDDAFLEAEAQRQETADVETLRQMPEALRHRILENLMKNWGIREPESRHIAMAESLVFSENPSAKADFPGGITLQRCYGSVQKASAAQAPMPAAVSLEGITELPQWGLRLTCAKAESGLQTQGNVVVRSRRAGDEIRLSGGTKSLKKLFIDKKIPASQRPFVPVLADDGGVLAAYGLGVNQERISRDMPGVQIIWEEI